MGASASVRQPLSDPSDPSLVSFGLLVLASVAWVVLVVLLLPRFLGRVLAFLANRASRGSFHVVIPSLQIYPLAGRAVAHSVRYTVPDGTVSVEELVLQVRWWRRAPESQFRQLLAVDDAHTLDPVVHAQQQLERENDAAFVKRTFFKLRRWWTRNAVTTDALASKEPPPLISLICVGLRARLVNVEANYDHVNRVLNLAKASSRGGNAGDADFDVPLTVNSTEDVSQVQPDPDASSRSSSASSSYSSVQSFEAKPFGQRVLELVSLRITSGAFYLCDMGRSPLVRVVVNSAKVRYRYGAPACPIDECRKRFRVRLSGLQLSVADRDTVRAIVDPQASSREAPVEDDAVQDNTDRMIRRVMAAGYRGMNEPFLPANASSTKKRPRTHEKSSSSDSMQLPMDVRERGQGFRNRSRAERREARRKRALPCANILLSETTLVDYVFDEPGPIFRPQSSKRRSERAVETSFEGTTEDCGPTAAPICRVSIVLRGASFSYDSRAIADVERVIERLQPAFYDLMPFAMKVQSGDGKRSATGIQIEIDATPVLSSPSKGGDPLEASALISVPFVPRPATWKALSKFNIRNWQKHATRDGVRSGTKAASLPSSAVRIYARHVSIKTEVPYRIGAQQKTLLVGKEVSSQIAGVVDMSFCETKSLTVVRTLQLPQVWNDVHVSSVDVLFRESEFTYFPDTTRVIDDLSTTFAENSKKPLDVRYFIPVKETTRIRAENNYAVIMACSQDNAWEDILSGQADRNGRIKVCGEAGELLLSRNVPTEFFPESNAMSWTLSLPSAIGKLELPIPYSSVADQKGGDASTTYGASDSDRSMYHKGRPPSLAQRVRSQLSMHHHHERSTSVKRPGESITVRILQAGKVCSLTGKVLVKENRPFLESSFPAFLDSVNRSDVSFKASSLSLDVNPHHVSQFLSLTRNYAGTGTHTISTAERTRLHITRNRLARTILDERRYPNPDECIVLGLGAGQALSQIGCRTAMDELFCMSLQVESFVLRLHNLPHALCPFNEESDTVCSVESERIVGSFRSNRLGSDLTFASELKRNRLTLHCEYRGGENRTNLGTPDRHNLSSPSVLIDQFEIRKRTKSSPEWGPYHSALDIRIGAVSGCVMDESVVWLSQIAMAAMPEPLFDNQMAVAALLSVDNINVMLGGADLLILSACSNASAQRSGQVSKMYMLRKEEKRNMSASTSAVSTFLAGVTQLRVPVGLRFCMSNLASDTTANISRLTVPDISVDVLMSWGGKLTTWVDDATLRAQVAHAILAKKRTSQGSFHDVGLMRRVAEIRESTLEVVFDSRPGTWSPNVADQQKRHISQMAENVRGHLLAWCLPPSTFPEEEAHVLSTRDELNLWWWVFLRRARRASILSKHIAKNAKQQGQLESVSIALVSNAAIVLSPEGLELANDIVIRCKERVSGQESISRQRDHAVAENSSPEAMSSADVTAVWDAYEASRASQWTTPEEGAPSVSLRGFETKSVAFLLLSPMLPGEVRRNDELFQPEYVGDVVHISFPLGIHFVEVGKSGFSAAPEEDEHRSKPSSSHVVHIRDLHSSMPSFTIGCGRDDICKISGAILIFREKSDVRNAIHLPEQRAEVVREDKRTLVGKISSVSIGEGDSTLHLYACFGRVAAIFMLMSRALALEYSSLSSLRNHRLSSLCKSIFHVSPHELKSLSAKHVRGFLSELSKIVRDQTDSGKRRRVAFSEDLPLFVRDYATALVEQMKRRTVSSVDVAIRNISLQVAGEDILRADTFLCKGGSTAPAQGASVLEGHVLNASFGTISVSILDDVAANTLRMVSEVASFVRRAIFSVPMLRYDGHANSRLPASSDLLSFSFKNAKFVTAESGPVEQGRPSQEHKPQHLIPMLSQGLHRRVLARRSNIPRARLRGPRGGSFRAHRSSFGNNSNTGSSKYSGVLSSSSRHFFPRAVGHKPWDEEGGCIRSDAEGNNALRDIALDDKVPTRCAVDRRRSRPLSSANVDHRPLHSRRLFPSADTFEEDNKYYAYVAIPTAGETGPPRKRAKSKVRVSPIVPPAFSDFEKFSVQEDKIQHEMLFSHRNEDTKTSTDSRHAEGRLKEGIGEDMQQVAVGNITSASAKTSRSPVPAKTTQPKNRPPLTVFVSCREIISRYFRRNSPLNIQPKERKEAEIRCCIGEPRLTLMSAPSKGSYSLVITASSAKLTSANNPSCVLTGSISNMGVTISIAQTLIVSTRPKLIASARLSEFKTTLRAKDLISVLKFREEFKSDMKAVLSAFITTKSSITEMARAARLSSSKVVYPGRTLFSTMAFDLLVEQSRASLEGFHPKDSAMCMTYFLDGMFFSVVASEDDSAALTLGLRLYGHRLSLFAPSWPSEEIFHFPSLDARGVQWGETTGLPTLLKVSAEPLVNCTSIQGLRHVLFTVAGLMAFQNTIARAPELNEQLLGKSINSAGPELKDFYADPHGSSHTTGATPFTRSFAAWERTKGIRMDLSIRPMSISLASGQVVALFELDAISGIFEWNKLVVSGVQLHTAVNIPRTSLMFMRMPTAEFSFSDIRLSEHRASMSVALERSRIDVLKTQDDLTHTFIFRIDVFAVSGQLRPWRLLMDAAVWADEQEFVSDLQSINYTALSSSRPRSLKSPRPLEPANPLEHRVVLIGFNIQRFKLAVPLLSTEEYSSSRLVLRATELHLLVRQRFDSLLTPRKNILQVKTHFIGVLWENSALISTHHSRITLGFERPSSDRDAHFGAVNVVMVAGTWRVCPRKDVVMAILEAKNGKDNTSISQKSRDVSVAFPDMLSRGSSVAGDSVSTTTERHGRLLVQKLRFKMLRTSGFIEGLEGGAPLYQSSTADEGSSPHRMRTEETSKLSVPAFSVAMVRDESQDFDVIDIDFSGREGEFPRGCLQKVSNLFSELFGAVASDQQAHLKDVPVSPTRQSREKSRDVSVLIRFGRSLYRAQEEANASIESKFCFFAGRTSTILVSLSTNPIVEDECSHTTVISGISPKLALEITPLIEGAKVQSLRLIDARFLHAISPCRPPHTTFHVVMVTALLDTKTLLLTQGRLKARKALGNSVPVGSDTHTVQPVSVAERNIILVLGRSRQVTRPASDSDSGQSL